ncbi:MAG: proline dehydrogenase family protein [Armatimonadota bacterium]|nr:proline dehydrogenase family protein [Armatimonadota bacterium]MDR5696823.1 proline dehydrogenase family protein [Armatimonadota bacterium]
MLRQLFVWLSERKDLQAFVTRNRLAHRAARRFVAGDTLEDACRVLGELNTQGMLATLDFLGERTTNPTEAHAAAAMYRRVLATIAQRRLGANVSLKLTQMGIDLSWDLCMENMVGICDEAAQYGNFVRIDMESSHYTQMTLDLYRELRRRGYGPDTVGVVIQAYLYRSERDVEDLIAEGARVRLCKGAYAEAPDVAYPRKRDVDRNFVRLMERLLVAGRYPAIATHDEAIINHAKRFCRQREIPPTRYEFQMLYGIRRDLQRRLVREGYNLRIYVPFGTEWYPYFMRRLAERPANVGFLLLSLLRER